MYSASSILDSAGYMAIYSMVIESAELDPSREMHGLLTAVTDLSATPRYGGLGSPTRTVSVFPVLPEGGGAEPGRGRSLSAWSSL